MEQIHLRQLSWKSPLTGLVKNYGGNTVEWVMANHPGTLLYIYYRLEKITFLPEIINAIKAKYSKFYEIKKPGVDKDFYEKVFLNKSIDYSKLSYRELVSKMTGYRLSKKEIPSSLLQAWNKAKLLVMEQRDIKFNGGLSRAELQGINHGRFSEGDRVE